MFTALNASPAMVGARARVGRCALALLAGVAPCSAALAQADASPWVLRHTDPDTSTQVWLRDRGELAPAFRASTRLATRLSALVAVLLDAERMPDWVYRTREVQRLQQDGIWHGVSLVVTAMPWPLNDREAVVAWHLQQDTATRVVTLDGSQVEPAGQPWLPAPATDRVRMPSFASSWRFAPAPDAPGLVDIVFEGHGDPGGSLASPLLRGFVNAAVWQAPLQTVSALRRVVQRPEYRDAVLPFITEPPR